MSTTENSPVPTPGAPSQGAIIAAEERTLLPPPPQAPPPPPAVTPELLQGLARMDLVLVGLLLVLAFLLACFPIRNSDFFQTLRVGQLLVQRQYRFGEDPFSWASEPTSWVNSLTGEKVVWVNHSWLFGLLSYGLYSLAPGGQALVVFRGLLTAGLALLLVLAGRRPGQRLWLPASCAVLAVVALSPRLFLQSTLLSYFFLGLTLYLLERPQAQPLQWLGLRLGSWWLLPPLFVLWVNCDAWFLLGPITVALYLVGDLLHRLADSESAAGEPGKVGQLGTVLLVGVLACLINPYHLHAFTLPAQLGFSEAGRALHDDPHYRGLFISPLVLGGPFYQLSGAWSVFGLGYFALLILSLVSMILAGQVQRDAGYWRRAVLLVAFALLGLYSARAIPFFAVVAGPITALNMVAWVQRPDAPQPTRGGLLAGSWLLLGGAVLLVLAAIPGWVRPQPYSTWRLGWRLEPDPGLVRVAQHIKEWRKQGFLPENVHWYNTSPDLAHYLCWFCPGERTFVDIRLTPFASAAQDQAAISQGLAASLNGPQADPEWRQVFRKPERDIHYVLFSQNDAFRPTPLLLAMMSSFREFVPLALDGKSAIFAWKDLEQPGTPADAFSRLKLNLRREAFGPDCQPAPADRPARAPQVHPWYEAFWNPDLPRPLEAHRAEMLRTYFTFQRFEAGYRLHLARVYLTTSMFGAACLKSISPLPPLPIFLADIGVMRTLFQQPLGPPEGLHVAIRESRRALVENPDEARVYQLLGELYTTLGQSTPERDFSLHWVAGRADRRTGIPLPTQVRLVQALTALQQAIKLDPNLAAAHERLAKIYQELGYRDLVLKHQRELLRCLREDALRSGQSTEFITQRMKQVEAWEQGVNQEEEKLKKEEDEFEVKATKLPLHERAALAMSEVEPRYWLDNPRGQAPRRFGFLEKALQALEKIEGKDRSLPVVIAHMDLMLRLGRVDEVRQVLEERREWRNLLGPHPDMAFPAYEVFEVLVAAASGDYQAADKVLQHLAESSAIPQPRQEEIRQQLAQAIAECLLQQASVASWMGTPPPALIPIRVQAWQKRPQAEEQAFQVLFSLSTPANRLFLLREVQDRALGFLINLAREAELETVRGWLALEQGQLDLARECFAQADKVPLDFFHGKGMVRMGLEWLNEKR